MTMVKICGLREIEAALVAAEAGADYLGIVFQPNSRRLVALDDARQLVQAFRERWGKESPKWVGVFANQPLEDVNHMLEHCDMDLAQLSGDEALDYCLQVARPVLKVFHVAPGDAARTSVEQLNGSLATFAEAGHGCMLDTYQRGVHGGTGQAFDWQVAHDLAAAHSFLLAGGLNVDNVGEAIRLVDPWGVDVSSGVETAEEKDPAKIEAFIAAARQAEASLRGAATQ